ncbi:DUF1656 domain-containing protein [Phyllobacterium chamaecytisi]|uniref:DUF1656 domain-containing protein n=1 Tax=Phyllobacterium chamaecytisi TaxID=2876082 RepID=UPI001CCC67B3|nr:DUF1656 domain-containing protein [Phyllobacterium sp. KW56]MBZ9601381.1 DUF1656 domain-containing protein [Phyllobacterium sp. KW56]
MTPRYYDLVIGGVMLSPILLYACFGLAAAVSLRPILRRIRYTRLFVSPSIAEFSLYVSIFCLITLLA